MSIADQMKAWPSAEWRGDYCLRLGALEARLRTTVEALRVFVARCSMCDGTGNDGDCEPDDITGQVFPAACEFCGPARAILARLEQEGLA